MRRWSRFFPILAATALCLALFPETASAAPSPEGALASLQFQTGGVGHENRRMKPAGYQAKFIFVNTKGEYFADVRVTFHKDGEKRLVQSAGPWLWVKGEPGRYRIEARSSGAAAQRRITLPARRMAIVVFRLK